jgi:aldehyde dehydrogenase (NAD+)
MENLAQLERMRGFFQSGATLDYAFRREQLEKLRDLLIAGETELYDALRQDLGKSREESWVTEIGILISELKFTVRRLKTWMSPEKVPTNLLNLPSKSYVLREPLGLVLIIGPWNYPVQLLLNPLIGAIAAGNCAVLKPSEFTPATTAVLGKMIRSAFSPDYIMVAEGAGADVIPPMLRAFRFDHVFFTGSTAVGREIYKMAAERLVPVTLELGGKSPCVVEEDANIAVAARRIAVTKFSNAGQMCVAPDYVLVREKNKQEFIAELVKAVQSFFGEDASASPDYCRIVNEKQFDRLVSYLNDGKLVAGGRYDRAQRYIEPAIMVDVDREAPVMKEEVFGPILPVIGFESDAAALELIRQHPDPLSFYVYTGSREKERKWLERVPAGGSCINNASWHLTNPNLPFGGRGTSGTGRYHGRYSFDNFSHLRAVMKTPTWFDPALKYPPFKGRLKLYKKFIG